MGARPRLTGLAGLAILVTAGGGLTACAGGSADFTRQAEATCSTAARTIAALNRPSDPAAGLRYALDRYAAVELAVSTVTDSALPGGEPGQALRQGWLRPARASLLAARPALSDLQHAVADHDRVAAAAAFTRAAGAGTASVDVAVLRSQQLPSCADVFAVTPVAPGW